jgi:hypothetical protein
MNLVHLVFDNCKPCPIIKGFGDYALVEANGTLIAREGNWPKT